MWQFREAVRGIRDACTALGVPVVSGNVSFYNETDGRPIPPTPTIALVGLLDDVSHHTTQWFKSEGDIIVLLGRTREELGGSEYLAVVHDLVRGTPPWIDLVGRDAACSRSACRPSARAWCARRTTSPKAVSPSRWPSACISGPDEPLGAEIEMEAAIRPDAWLFGESQSRIVLSVRRKHVDRLRDLARAAEVPLTVLGEVRGRRLRIGSLIDVDVAELRARLGGRVAASHGGMRRHGATRSADEPDRFHEECGVVGVYGHPEAANLAYLGLYALQHRGQEGAGHRRRPTASCCSRTAASGWSPTSSTRRSSAASTGSTAIGHNRYSTAGGRCSRTRSRSSSSSATAAWPSRTTATWSTRIELREQLEARGSIFQSSVDTEVIVHLIAGAAGRDARRPHRRRARRRCAAPTRCCSSSQTELIAVRDPNGFRPLVLGRIEDKDAWSSRPRPARSI